MMIEIDFPQFSVSVQRQLFWDPSRCDGCFLAKKLPRLVLIMWILYYSPPSIMFFDWRLSKREPNRNPFARDRTRSDFTLAGSAGWGRCLLPTSHSKLNDEWGNRNCPTTTCQLVLGRWRKTTAGAHENPTAKNYTAASFLRHAYSNKWKNAIILFYEPIFLRNTFYKQSFYIPLSTTNEKTNLYINGTKIFPSVLLKPKLKPNRIESNLSIENRTIINSKTKV